MPAGFVSYPSFYETLYATSAYRLWSVLTKWKTETLRVLPNWRQRSNLWRRAKRTVTTWWTCLKTRDQRLRTRPKQLMVMLPTCVKTILKRRPISWILLFFKSTSVTFRNKQMKTTPPQPSPLMRLTILERPISNMRCQMELTLMPTTCP